MPGQPGAGEEGQTAANPLSSGEVAAVDAAAAIGGGSICEHPATRWSRQLTKEDGSPTPLFRVVQFASIQLPVFINVGGTFYCPSLVQAYEAADWYMLAHDVLVGVWGSLFLFILSEARQGLRTDSDGLLPRLGVGKTIVTAGEAKKLRLVNLATNHTFGGLTNTLYSGPCVLIAVAVGLTGAGAHSPLHNTVSAVSFALLMVMATPAYAWVLVELHAATLMGAKIRNIGIAMDKELESDGDDMSDAEWDAQVAKPCKQLVADLKLMSDRLGAGLVLWTAFALVISMHGVCWVMSPFGSTLQESLRLAMRIFFCFFAIAFGNLPFVLMSAPASTSSAAGGLIDKLNAIRLNDLTIAADTRVGLLERALERCNRGQGIGFCVGGVVVDTATLRKLMAQIYGLLLVVLPFVISGGDTEPSCELRMDNASAASVCTCSLVL